MKRPNTYAFGDLSGPVMASTPDRDVAKVLGEVKTGDSIEKVVVTDNSDDMATDWRTRARTLQHERQNNRITVMSTGAMNRLFRVDRELGRIASHHISEDNRARYSQMAIRHVSLTEPGTLPSAVTLARIALRLFLDDRNKKLIQLNIPNNVIPMWLHSGSTFDAPDPMSDEDTRGMFLHAMHRSVHSSRVIIAIHPGVHGKAFFVRKLSASGGVISAAGYEMTSSTDNQHLDLTCAGRVQSIPLFNAEQYFFFDASTSDDDIKAIRSVLDAARALVTKTPHSSHIDSQQLAVIDAIVSTALTGEDTTRQMRDKLAGQAFDLALSLQIILNYGFYMTKNNIQAMINRIDIDVASKLTQSHVLLSKCVERFLMTMKNLYSLQACIKKRMLDTPILTLRINAEMSVQRVIYTMLQRSYVVFRLADVVEYRLIVVQRIDDNSYNTFRMHIDERQIRRQDTHVQGTSASYIISWLRNLLFNENAGKMMFDTVGSQQTLISLESILGPDTQWNAIPFSLDGDEHDTLVEWRCTYLPDKTRLGFGTPGDNGNNGSGDDENNSGSMLDGWKDWIPTASTALSFVQADYWRAAVMGITAVGLAYRSGLLGKVGGWFRKNKKEIAPVASAGDYTRIDQLGEDEAAAASKRNIAIAVTKIKNSLDRILMEHRANYTNALNRQVIELIAPVAKAELQSRCEFFELSVLSESLNNHPNWYKDDISENDRRQFTRIAIDILCEYTIARALTSYYVDGSMWQSTLNPDNTLEILKNKLTDLIGQCWEEMKTKIEEAVADAISPRI